MQSKVTSKEKHGEAMGGERGECQCVQCGSWVLGAATCDRCRLHTCVDCGERLKKREEAMSKRLDLDWSKVDLCLMCLDILQLKTMKGIKASS